MKSALLTFSVMLGALLLVNDVTSKVISHRNRRQDEAVSEPERDEAVTAISGVTEAPTSIEQGILSACALHTTDWSPWSGKGENINRKDCGTRRRTRRFKDDSVSAECLEAGVELVEFESYCDVTTRDQTTESFQFYFVDAIFGHTAETNEDSRRRRRGLSFENFFFQANHRPVGSECPEDKSRQNVDFLVMLDKSSSMVAKQFQQLIKSIVFLVKRGLPSVSQSTTRMAMITFANQPHVEFNFNECDTKLCVLKRTRKAVFTGGQTHMAAALTKASEVFEERNGMRSCSRKVILLLTDGSSDRAFPSLKAHALKSEKDVEIFVMAVSALINELQLKAIVSEPVLTHLYYVPTTKQVRKVCKSLKEARARDY